MKRKWISFLLTGGLVAASLGSSVNAYAFSLTDLVGAASEESTAQASDAAADAGAADTEADAGAADAAADTTADANTAADAGAATDTAETADPAADTAEEESADLGIITGYALEQTGTAADASGMYVNYDALHYASGSSTGKVIFENGTESDDVYDFEYLGGYYTLTNDLRDNEINCTGLYSGTGEQLIPYEFAYAEWVDTSTNYYEEEISHRYLNVTYSDGLAEDESEAYFYLTSAFFSFAPSDGDVLYKGHGKIYDTEAGQFVPNIELTDPALEVYECGDSIVVEDNGVLTMYSANGETLMTTGEGYYNYASSSVGAGVVAVRYGQGYVVYNDAGEELFTTTNTLAIMSSTSGYLKQLNENSKYEIIDSAGNKIIDQEFNSVYSESCGYFNVESTSGTSQVIDINGNVIAESTQTYAVSELSSGYFSVQENDGSYSVYGPNGQIAGGLDSTAYNLNILNDNNAIVLNTGEEIALGGNATEIGTGLVNVKDDYSGMYGLYDLFTGEKLLESEYETISATDTHVYAEKDGSWEIYSLNPIYAE